MSELNESRRAAAHVEVAGMLDERLDLAVGNALNIEMPVVQGELEVGYLLQQRGHLGWGVDE